VRDEIMQQVAYCKQTDDYEIYDEYGGSSLDLKEAKKLIELIRKTHPELLEKPKERSFFAQMTYYDDMAAKMIFLASESCNNSRDGNCTVPRKKCPFKINGGDGNWYCRKEQLEEAMME
jgi:hypothetical protein